MSKFIISSLLLSTAAAFCPSSMSRSVTKSVSLRAAEGEQTVKDLNLEEMFEVFEAADTAPGSGPKMGSKFDPKSYPGVSGPFGFFDPLALCPDNEETFKKFRENELKHGRIAMIAVLGVVIGESGLNFFSADINGPAIYQYQQAEGLFNAWSFNVVGFTAAVEGFNIVKGWQSPAEKKGNAIANLKENYVNGDLYFDPLNLKPKDPVALKLIQTKEINNGRLAMLAIAGIIAQELVTNEAIF